MFWNRKRQQQEQESRIYKRAFNGNQFDYAYDESRDTYTVTSFMKMYVMTEQAARDADAWALEQKKLFEKAQRFAREFNMVAPEPGCERPLIADWYNGITNIANRDANITVYDLEKMERREYTPRFERDLRIRNWQRFAPSEYGIDSINREASVLENGVRYVGNEYALKDSINNFYRNTIEQSDGEHIPTLSEWFKSLGISHQFRKEVVNKQKAEA